MGSHTESEATTIFVGNLPLEMTCEKVANYLGTFGNVISVIIKNPGPNHAKKFAFVKFAEEAAAETAIMTKSCVFDGIQLQFLSKKNKFNDKKLFVGGFAPDVRSKDVRIYFHNFGKVINVVMPMKNFNENRGYAFVTFEDEYIVHYLCDVRYLVFNNTRIECKKPHTEKMHMTVVDLSMLAQNSSSSGSFGNQ